jgi:predicted KAP-like P-loop ATPase
MTDDFIGARGAHSNYLSDSPLPADADGLKRDELGFDRLSSHIVSEIDRCPTAEGGFVFGINGKWGSGKSTLLNQVQYKLHKKDSYLVMCFNPWLQPGRDHVEAFFYDLAATFRLLPEQKSYLRIVQSIEKFANSLAATSLAFAGLAKVLNLLTAILSLFVTSIVIKMSPFEAIGTLVSGGISLVASLWIVDKIADRFLVYYRNKSRPPLLLVKEDLAHRLGRGTKRVVVIIDDIDRLPPKDICQIFQLVKNNGDLPNLIYLLGFDRTVVRDVLTKEYTPAYSQFSEKIVQQEFPIPLPERSAIPHFVERELDRAIADCVVAVSLKQYWSVNRWTNTWVLHLQGFVTTIRNAKRIINSVRMHMPLMVEEGTVEIDPVDFLVMQFLSVKFPDLCDYIGRNKNVFIYTRHLNRFSDLSDSEKRDMVDGFDNALKLVPLSERESVRELIQQLFPRAGTAEIGIHAHPPADDDADRMRIFYEPIFERYFTYLIYEGDLSNAVVESAYKALSQPDRFLQVAGPFRKSPRLRVLLDKVRRRLTRLEDMFPYRSNFISLVLELADDMTDDKDRPDEPVHWFVPNTIELTLRDKTPEVRANILQGVIPSLKRPFGLLTCLGIWEAEAIREPGIDHFLSRERLDSLIQDSIRLGQEWFNSKQWLDHPHFPRLLWLVKHWSAPEFEATLKGRLADVKELNKFVAHYLRVVETVKYGEVAGSVEYKFNFVGAKEVIDLGWLYQRVGQISTDETDSETVKIALAKFREDYPRYLSGELREP